MKLKNVGHHDGSSTFNKVNGQLNMTRFMHVFVCIR